MASLGYETNGERRPATFPSGREWEGERVREREEQRTRSESCCLNSRTGVVQKYMGANSQEDGTVILDESSNRAGRRQN